MLVEVLVAVLIFSLGILAVIGLQAVAVTNVSDAKYRADASLIANQLIGQMWVDQGNLASYGSADGKVTDLAELPNGKRKVTINGQAVTVEITWQAPTDAGTRTHTTVARIYSGERL